MRLRFLGTLATALVLCGGFSAARAADEKKPPARGLKGEYFAGRNLDRRILERVDPSIECFWEGIAPAAEVPADEFSVRWTGWIKPPVKGRYKLVVACDDGVRLWIDGEQVIDRYVTGNRVTDCSLELSDEPHAIRLEYFDAEGSGWIVLLWQHIDSPHMAVVPQEALFLDEASARTKVNKAALPKTGLTAEYFDKSFRRKFGTAVVPRTEALWVEGGPSWEYPTDLCARYTGFLVPPATGKYKLSCYADDAVRVWLDDKPVIENRIDKRKIEVAHVDLTAGTPCPLKIEFTDQAGWGSYYLHWTLPDGTQELSIPPERLFQTKLAGLKAVEAGDLK